jgi:hypothetical protein
MLGSKPQLVNFTNKTAEKRHIFAKNFETTMYYKLIRENSLLGASGVRPKEVRGTLYQISHRFSRSAGIYKEYLTPICDTLENADYLVPALIYKIQVTQSPKFKRLLPLLSQVPNRSGIRFHRGSLPEHSKGCILISASMEQSLTARWLAEQSASEETRLEICNNINYYRK